MKISSKKRIGIDARILFYNRSGISRFARGFIDALPTDLLSAGQGDLEIIIFQSWKSREFIKAPPTTRQLKLFTPAHFPLENLTLRWEIGRQQLSLLHSIDFFSSIERRVPTICSIYDLYFLKDKLVLDPKSHRHYSNVFDAARYAKHIITVSEASKRDIVELLKVAENKVSVVYPGVEKWTAESQQHLQQVKTKYDIRLPFALFVGTLEPRKNLKRLIQAFKKIEVEGVELLLVGRKGPEVKDILSLIQENGFKNIRYLGELADEDVRALYSLANLVVYPSLYEGFGFPLLEAMAAGVPVVTSNVSSLPEIGAQAAHYVDPMDVDDIKMGIVKLLTDNVYREELIGRGRERVKAFSWTRCAKQILELYQRFA